LEIQPSYQIYPAIKLHEERIKLDMIKPPRKNTEIIIIVAIPQMLAELDTADVSLIIYVIHHPVLPLTLKRY
jgi:hypothetical protein